MRIRRKKKAAMLDNAGKNATTLDRAAGAMIGLGALDWGLVGLANIEAFRAVLGKKGARAIHTLIGASAAYAVARSARLARA
jgi:uncharacterized membrane protein YuzA (DUF378 family)